MIPLDETDGNHIVLDLGNGNFVLYAHLVPGSITVAEGDHVQRGDVLGLVGNSGNTSAPHLHLHVMSTPSGLAANGLPYHHDQDAGQLGRMGKDLPAADEGRQAQQRCRDAQQTPARIRTPRASRR